MMMGDIFHLSYIAFPLKKNCQILKYISRLYFLQVVNFSFELY